MLDKVETKDKSVVDGDLSLFETLLRDPEHYETVHLKSALMKILDSWFPVLVPSIKEALLHDRIPERSRIALIEACGAAGRDGLLETLVQLIEGNHSPAVKKAAVRALAGLKCPAARESLKDLLETVAEPGLSYEINRLLQEVARRDPASLYLKRLLVGNRNPSVCIQAAKALRRICTAEHYPSIQRAFENEDYLIKIKAAELMAALGMARGLDSLLNALVETAQRFGRTAAVLGVLRPLEDGCEALEPSMILSALECCGGTEEEQILLSKARRELESGKLADVQLLFEQYRRDCGGESEQLPVSMLIAGLLGSPEEMAALSRQTVEYFKTSYARDKALIVSLLQSVCHLVRSKPLDRDRAYGIIERIAGTEDDEIRQCLADFVAVLQEPQAMALAARLAKDPDWGVRMKVCQALGNHTNQQARELVLDGLRDVKDEVVEASVYAAVSQGDRNAVIAALVRDEDWRLRAAATRLLADYPFKDAQRLLMERLDDERWEVVECAVESLTHRMDAGCIGALGKLILRTPKQSLVNKAANAVGIIGTPEGARALLDLVPRFRREAQLIPIVQSLGRILRSCGRSFDAALFREALSILEKTVDAKDSRLRCAALNALSTATVPDMRSYALLLDALQHARALAACARWKTSDEKKIIAGAIKQHNRIRKSRFLKIRLDAEAEQLIPLMHSCSSKARTEALLKTVGLLKSVPVGPSSPVHHALVQSVVDLSDRADRTWREDLAITAIAGALPDARFEPFLRRLACSSHQGVSRSATRSLESVAANKPMPQARSAADASWENPHRVRRGIVVEGSPFAESLIGEYLREARAGADFAGSTEEALELLQTADPEFLILDVESEGYDADKILRAVAALRPNGPSVFVTTVYRQSAAYWRERGAEKVLLKPLTGYAVLCAIRSCSSPADKAGSTGEATESGN